MKNNELSNRIKNLRIRKGFSQEELAEISGLSLRTIQRIENDETEPRGDSLKKLAAAFNVSPDEIIDWTLQEDKGLLISINLSALTFLVFPILGILLPLIVWIPKKDKVRDINNTAKSVLNFQITWVIALFSMYISLIFMMVLKLEHIQEVSAGTFRIGTFAPILFAIILYGFNFIMIITNILRINNGKSVRYFPKIRFIK